MIPEPCDPCPLTLSQFQQWLTVTKGMTTTEAVSVCTLGSHDVYVRLFDEWRTSCEEEVPNGTSK